MTKLKIKIQRKIGNVIVCYYKGELLCLPNSNKNVETESFSAMKKYLWLNGYRNPRDYELAVKFYLDGNCKIEKYSDMQQINKRIYQFYKTKDFLIEFEEPNTESVTSLGYLVFDNGDKIRIESNSDAIFKSKSLMGECRTAIDHIMNKNNIIQKYSMDNFSHHIKIDLINSQEAIYICHNGQLMALNQDRKEKGMRCLPYDKSMDKYLTIYMYSTMEYVPQTPYIEKFKDFKNIFINELESIHGNEFKFHNINFMGRIYT